MLLKEDGGVDCRQRCTGFSQRWRKLTVLVYFICIKYISEINGNSNKSAVNVLYSHMQSKVLM
jgi:hypothetical protein